MDLGLEGSVAAVVGGAGGIGLAIAKAFSAEGADVAIIDLPEGARKSAEGLAKESRRRVTGVPCDVASFEAVQAAEAEVRKRFARIDHVVFAAAIGSGQFGFPFLKVEPAVWSRVVDVNLLGAVHVAHAFAPGLVAARRGTLLFLASVAGQIGSQTDPPYSASKAAVINFAQCVAKDLAPHEVRVNSLCPGMVKTALNRSVWEAWNAEQLPEKRRTYEEWAGDKVRQVVPLGRWQEPEDVANMAVFLASDRARNVTGQTINVDGGYVMHW